jgi:putative endonuclease
MARRYQEHVKGTIKCKFTRSFKPIRIEQCWRVYGDKNIAMKVEKYIKSLNKKAKKHLIESPHKLTEILQNSQ